MEFGGRADGQVVRQICVVVLALRRSVSFFVNKLVFDEFPVIASQFSNWRGNLPDRRTHFSTTDSQIPGNGAREQSV